MSANAKKLLLINFSQKEADAIEKKIPCEAHRGFISKPFSAVDYSGRSSDSYQFWTPVPPYECDMVFIKMSNYDELEDEFSDNLQFWSERDRSNLEQYWKRNGTLLVFYIGETSGTSLDGFGVPIDITASSGVDTESLVSLKQDRLYRKLIDDLRHQIKMPTTKYLEVYDDSILYRRGTITYIAMRNRNNDALMAMLSKSNTDYDASDPGVLVVPETKDVVAATSKIASYFTQSDIEWANDDSFYPSKTLTELTDEISAIRLQAAQEIEARELSIEKHKKKYSYLKDLVVSQGDVLVDAVSKTLSEAFGLNVIKSDENNPTNPKEDLLVEYAGKQILLEVKGTINQNPSLKFPQQAMQHALRQGLKDISATGLVLNHDLKTNPDLRTEAYNTSETSPLIADIYFIDTRLLLTLARDVLDGKLNKEGATAAIFSSFGKAVYPD